MSPGFGLQFHSIGFYQQLGDKPHGSCRLPDYADTESHPLRIASKRYCCFPGPDRATERAISHCQHLEKLVTHARGYPSPFFFLADLKKHTSVANPDYDDLDGAIKMITGLAIAMNHAQKKN